MAQLTIYLPDEIERQARKVAKARGTTLGRWIAEVVSANIEEAWPKEVIDVMGAFPNFPDLDQIRSGFGPESPREPLECRFWTATS